MSEDGAGRVKEWRQWAAVCALVLLGVLPAFMQMANSDVAWLVYAARRVTRGATLYVDLVEINPPLIVWLSIPATWLADLLGTSDYFAFLVTVVLLAVCSLATIYAVLRRSSLALDASTARGFVALFALGAVGLSGSVFGQREQVMLLATAPYLVLAAVRARAGTVPLALAVLSGVLAGIGFAIKPHFVLVWLAVEALLWARRGRRALVRPEVACVVLVGLLYAVSILVFAPEYLTLVDRLGAIYTGSRQTTLLEIVMHPVTLALGVGLIYWRIIRVRGIRGELVLTSAVAGAGFLLVVAIQGQGFYYHYFPVVAWTIVLMGLLIWGRDGGSGWRDRVPWAATALVLVWLVGLALTGSWADETAEEIDRRATRVAEYLRGRSGGGPLFVGVFSPQHSSAYPLINRAGAVSTLRFNGFWPLTVLCGPRCRKEGSYLDGTIEPGSKAEEFTREGTIQDLVSRPADFLLFDQRMIEETFTDVPFDYVGYLAADPRARSVLAEYRCGHRLEGYLICEHRDPTGGT